MADTAAHENQKWNISFIKGINTDPELQLHSLRHRADFWSRLYEKKLPRKPNMVLPKYRDTIFVHGCFWHHHEGCRNTTTPSIRTEFWQSKFDSNVNRDERNRIALQAAGWTIFTVWECELESDAFGVVARLSRKIGETS